MRAGFDKKNDEMDYAQAVALAREGKEEGFNFLYENTFREKYYIAIKYMKNEENAKDVLQDAYIKAFNKLDTLKDANAFPGWIGQIVANTAKNALLKKNPILFSEMEGMNDDSFKWKDQTEDDNKYYQPEEAYTAKETQEMVYELLESLSDEQRLCMLMFYIEELSIKEIAEAFNCSENTVKSRLNYGRKNLKNQAEVLKKKGYKLYSFAPVSLLLYLLHSEKELFIPTKAVAAASIYSKITSNLKMGKVIGEGVKEAVKQTFIHTVAGKITMTVVGVAIVGAVSTETLIFNDTDVFSAMSGQKNQAEEKAWTTLSDADYPNLINGNLTKEQLAFMLGYGPETIRDGNVDDATLSKSLIDLNDKFASSPMGITQLNQDYSGYGDYSTTDINRIFSIFKDNAFTSGFNQPGITVKDNVITISLVTVPENYKTAITSADYSGDEMVINYDVLYTWNRPGASIVYKSYKRTAYLEKQESGLFQIKVIESEEQQLIWKQLYINQLKTVTDGESTYRASLPSWNQNAVIAYQYALCDMDNNGIPELIVNTIVDGMGTCRIYKASADSTGILPLNTADTINAGAASAGGSRAYLAIPADGNGIYECSFYSIKPDVDVSRFTISGDTLIKTEESTMQMKTDAYNAFNAENKMVEWIDIEDLQALQ